MGEYTGLPGVKGGTLKPRGKHFARTVNGFMVILRKGRICSAAGDNGSCTVWRDDNGLWRCEFSRWRSSVNETTCTKKTEVRQWLKDWLPLMHESRSAAVEPSQKGGGNV